MALQTSGAISLSNVATEFKVATPLSNVALSSFYKTTSANYLQVKFVVTSETVTAFTGGSTPNANGTIRIYVNGLSGNYTVGVNGRANINLSANFQNAFFTNFAQASYTVTITDNSSGVINTFSVYVNRGDAASSITSYTNNAWNTVRLGQSLGNIAGKVKSIPSNVNIPVSGQIKLSDFYAAAYYYLSVKFDVTSETVTTFTGGSTPNANGTIRVYLSGASNNYTVYITGRAAQQFTNNGNSAYFTGLTSGSYDIVVSAVNNVSYVFTAVISAGTSYVVGRNLNTEYNIA
jgi:hypothetical protein